MITRGGSLLASALLVMTSCFLPVSAAEKQEGPSEVKSATVSGFMPETLNLEFSDQNWMNQIEELTVDGSKYVKGTISWGTSEKVWQVTEVTGAYGSYRALKLVNPDYPAQITIKAKGYQTIKVKVEKNAAVYPYEYKATVEKESGSQSGSGGQSGSGNQSGSGSQSGSGNQSDGGNTAGKINLSQLKLSLGLWGSTWKITVSDADAYVAKVKEVSVNGKVWTENPYSPNMGGRYQKKAETNQLIFAAQDFSAAQTIPILKSGDSVRVKAEGYEDLSFKFLIDADGNASLAEDDQQGDPYELRVKLQGSFEAAIKGQKNYDGVTSASLSGASQNKNSNVKVYGALVKKGQEPKGQDWEELDHTSKIQLDPSQCRVNFVPDTASGTAAGSQSGMEGRYLTLSSSLTLSGTPKDPGRYLISVSVADRQGRVAVSNSLPFTVYSGQEKLADQLKEENLKKYANGLMAWDIMEPWAIREFGSNVSGQDNAVRVPAKLEVWFGSHESGTYGVLGYDIAWEDVEQGRIPPTLYIPAGCDLTLKNMKILSSVRIVVEKGGKLTLSDSTVQGIIDVQDGGKFSMNYDSFAGKFTTGASICGQLRLADGAILENAAIYSNANYLANGSRTDRTTAEPVVTMSGNVTVKGQVFIRGDEAGSDRGQTALRVRGRIHLEDGAQLAAYGGAGKVLLNAKGGNAIELEEGSKIDGKGKVIAIGGDVLWGDGGNAISGKGSIETAEAFLQGANASKLRNSNPGKAIAGEVKVTSFRQHIADGAQSEAIGADDPLLKLYWRTGIDPTPAMDLYQTREVKPEGQGKGDPQLEKPKTEDPSKENSRPENSNTGNAGDGKSQAKKPKEMSVDPGDGSSQMNPKRINQGQSIGQNTGAENRRITDRAVAGKGNRRGDAFGVSRADDQLTANHKTAASEQAAPAGSVYTGERASVGDTQTAAGDQAAAKSQNSTEKNQEQGADKAGVFSPLLIGIIIAIILAALLTGIRYAIVKRK